MAHQLAAIFGELGISQYLDTFIEQGFDTWETILDITESDLDVLGVKLGHRRKLQRRIANYRGLAPEVSLAPLAQPSIEDSRPPEVVPRAEPPKLELREPGTVIVTKRKYRRHPKADENAPERPPSAYVLFSNKMREDLKGRNLSFTEIAKLVGENWQNLTPAEKEPYESKAQAYKEKYHAELAEYKKTAQYQKYMQYLADFKAKHSLPSQDKESSKRVKLSESGGPSSAAATPTRTCRSGSGGSDSLHGSEPPPSREQRISSIVSTTDSHHSAALSPRSYHDDAMQSPRTIHADRQSPEQRSPTAFNTSAKNHPLPNRTETARPEEHGQEQPLSTPQSQQNLPSFSDVFDSHRFMPGASQQSNEPSSYFSRGSLTNSPGPPPGLVGGDRRYPPALKKEQSSAGSISSASTTSSYGYPRTPTDGPLPIQALLSSSSSHSYNEAGQPHHAYPTGPLPVHQKQPQHQQQQPPALASLRMTNGMPWRKLPSLTRDAADEAVVGYHRALSLAHAPPAVTNGAHSTAATSHSINAVYGIPPPPQPHQPSQMGPGQVQHQQQYHHHHQQQPQQQGKPERGNPNLDGMSALLKAGEIVDRRTH
ncbi:hypothetical protein SMAC4_00615 [Sordaria macrospora]|uniref:WGS project CABT00000000 data, contig 2.1 n=1 Tax=Sordaria macrospora (strain ATCC MYA-333 / DSM 997 / K(L3346) / K-hell) TaxID=771870 RepID=F7VLM2_SORMK|nr:uncharacterized protein SMAC_00615 [Sordaria macrospora k-hell]WPJ59367.1 hypothetical protein SMAC4_00615 [Sordaria macrospora]CCC06400.1 unnamed protein product [Sordaria macrospora k-hell]